MSESDHGPWIQLVDGDPFDLLNPTPDQVRLADIAYSLSRLARYNGHTVGPLPWNVAQHSMLVEQLLAPTACVNLRLAALLHDAHEAYTGDITRPMKQAIRALSVRADPISSIELAIDTAVRKAVSLPTVFPTEWHQAIKDADLEALFIEAKQLMAPSHREWGLQPPLVDRPKVRLVPMEPMDACRAFLDRAVGLIRSRHSSGEIAA